MKTIGGKIASFTLAYVRWIQKGMKVVPSSEFTRRKSICDSCEHNVTQVCNLCGCPLAKKLHMATEKCPDKRWDQYEGTDTTRGRPCLKSPCLE